MTWDARTISIQEDFIAAAARNADAAKNGRGVVLKNKFLALHHSPDETLWSGQCQGSGKVPYLCSANFPVPERAVHRCTCPSRQFATSQAQAAAEVRRLPQSPHGNCAASPSAIVATAPNTPMPML